MDDQQKEQEVFRQNLNEKGNSRLYSKYICYLPKKAHTPTGKRFKKHYYPNSKR